MNMNHLLHKLSNMKEINIMSSNYTNDLHGVLTNWETDTHTYSKHLEGEYLDANSTCLAQKSYYICPKVDMPQKNYLLMITTHNANEY